MVKAKGQKTNEKYLDNSQVVLSRVYQKNVIHNIVLSWRVPHYEKVECNAIHFQLYKSIDIKCVLRLFKKENSLYLCVSSSTLPKGLLTAEFMIIDEVNKNAIKGGASKISEGVFATEFQNEQFSGSGLTFLKDDVLTIAFQYPSDRYTTYTESALDSVEILSDMDDLCCDLKNMYLEALYSDFLIHVRDYSFKTHKFILAARSKYFGDFFMKKQDAKDITLDALPGIAHEVFLYLYSGELKDMDLDCMLRVYELGLFLEVHILCERCIDYFKATIDSSNYVDMYKYSDGKNGWSELKNIVVHFLSETMPGIKIVDIYKKVETALAEDGGTDETIL